MLDVQCSTFVWSSLLKLPNSENVAIPIEKLTEYLLSESHLVGRWKARFFRSIGFGHEQVDALNDALMLLAKSGEVVVVISTDYGVKYVVEGWIESPKKQRALVRTVWVVEKEEDRPRLVTAYPA